MIHVAYYCTKLKKRIIYQIQIYVYIYFLFVFGCRLQHDMVIYSETFRGEE